MAVHSEGGFAVQAKNGVAFSAVPVPVCLLEQQEAKAAENHLGRIFCFEGGGAFLGDQNAPFLPPRGIIAVPKPRPSPSFQLYNIQPDFGIPYTAVYFPVTSFQLVYSWILYRLDLYIQATYYLLLCDATRESNQDKYVSAHFKNLFSRSRAYLQKLWPPLTWK